ncbi:transcriptional regulator, merr family [hydrocarbon metagenome]|uniref:Transcriptional regulator, merr family n=1 Tax=hydrocarbon metagenome TaxID=938273 RepID=A0A0W8E3L5_9ZZZZ
MKQPTYSTKEIADLSGVHPNTVRLYESWGYISSPQRLKNNYRVFTDLHLIQMKLARTALPGPYPVDGKQVHQLVKEFASGNLEVSLDLAKEYLQKVQVEQKRAFKALSILDDWFVCRYSQYDDVLIKGRKKAAQEIGVTLDTLRTWERNGLFAIHKDDLGKLTFTQQDLEKIEVIRLLRNCGYSISSLLRVFNLSDTVQEKPSLLLSLPGNDEDFFYVTDRFVQYLQDHKERAEHLISMIEKYMQDRDSRT